MDRLVMAGLMNGALATLLALGVFAVTRGWRNPYFGRIAWLAVLLKLVTPPLLLVPVETSWLQSTEATADAVAAAAVTDPPRPNAWQPPATVLAETESPVAASLVEPTATPPEALLRDAEATAKDSHISGALPYEWPDLLRLLGVLWISGSLWLGILACVRISRFQRLIARSTLAATPVQDRAVAIAARLGLSRAPPVRVVTGRMAPLAWSFGRHATVAVPSALVESLDADALDAVLAHELTHLGRRDHWARWLELVATTLYWWCPAAWFARRRVHEAEEQCCDADVLRTFPALRRGYGRALLVTLDLLAGEQLTAPGASGWGSHRSLRRRFERIAENRVTPPLADWRRRAVWGIAGALCLTTLTAADAPPASDVESMPCTITLEDGSVINGTLIGAEGDRMTIVLSPHDAAPIADESDERESSAPRRRLAKEVERQLLNYSLPRLEWDLSLEQCVNFSFHFRPGYRILRESGAKEPATVWPSDDNRQSLTIVQQEAERIALQVAEDYWKLFQCYARLAARQEAQESALKAWRLAKARHRVGSVGGSDGEEAQTRAHYYLCREQVSQAAVELHAAEAKLRSAMNLSGGDRRLIRPTSVPSDKTASIDLKVLLKVAFAKRIELSEQAKRWQEQQKLQQEALAAADASSLSALAKRSAETKAQHHQLLARREAAVLDDMKLSIIEGLTSAVRDLQLKKAMLATNHDRRRAAQDEVAAVTAIYETGRTSLDLMLQSYQRAVVAEDSYQESLVDHAVAALKVEEGQGTLLESLGVNFSK